MKDQFVNYQEEYVIHNKADKQIKPDFAAILHQTWNRIVHSIATTNEPKLYTRKSNGSTYWEAYDPLLGRRVFFDSETEVRAWLDRRYYQ